MAESGHAQAVGSQEGGTRRDFLILAASAGNEGPGPMVANLVKSAGTFPIPVAIVPGHLSDEDLDSLT